MADERERIEVLLDVVMHLVFTTWPDEAAYLIGRSWGKAMVEGHQKPGEWRSYNVDGYRFSIKRDTNGELIIQREEK